jgi:hypothetical protein
MIQKVTIHANSVSTSQEISYPHAFRGILQHSSCPFSTLDICIYVISVRVFFFSGEGPRSRRYRRIAALRFLVQPCDEDDDDDYYYFLSFS